MGTKTTRRQLSLAYWGCVAREWLANTPEQTVRRMLREMVEYSEVHRVADIETILEIATGKRCA
jgi:hypothetical protein